MVSEKRFLDDDVVISGMSGRFPECDTVEEFYEKLLSAVDLVKENDSRWPKGYLNTHSRMGFIKDLRKFDASFFGMHPKLAERTDPIVRILLETSVEAVIDAGICPTTLRGSETAVIVAVSSNEAADWWSADPDRVNGYEFLGCTRTMYSNRISFVLDLKGPSYTVDSQSSSGLLGIQQAYYMLKTGMVDAVIVAGVNLILNPHFNIMIKKLGILSPEGKCKVFDADADGYVRSEAGVALFIQRARDAKRIYSTVLATHSNCDGFKGSGCNAESLASQIDLYEETISKFNINPLDISFIETHGYATLEGDQTELTGIAEMFCKGRESPLMIGSVKSNMGHAEPAGGLVSVVKVLLAMEHDILFPNLHFKNANPNVLALRDGRLKVVDKLTVWNGRYAAVNSFGIGGTNSHLILKRNEKEKKSHQKTDIPRLMVVSGRTEESVRFLLDKVKHLQYDDEFCALLYDVFRWHIPHFNYRGYAVYNDETKTEITMYTAQDARRPVCFVFSGMGSQWTGMGKNLLQLRNFKRTIDTCAGILTTVDFDLYALFNSTDKKVFNNVLNSFVGITCMQIAFVDVLFELGIKPDLIIGHSVGELACAYADETLTLEQTVLTTYWRGRSLLMTDLPLGAMAAIGLHADEVCKLLPTDISIACYNSSDSVTISGPPESIDDFVKKLQSEGTFATRVNSSGFAFHSQYIAKAGPIFKKTLEKIILEPQVRSKRWISTSVPDSLCDSSEARYSSVAYHLNNLLSPVHFDRALKRVPDNAIVIEIAPHALLQSILKASLSSTCSHVGLIRRNQASVTDFLSNIGRLYNAGLQPDMDVLYSPVSFPVSRKTPMIQSLIEWDHSIKWFLVSFVTKPACLHGEIEKVVDITEKEYEFLTDSIIDDFPTFPVSGFLYLIWEAVAKVQIKFLIDVSVVIENVQILQKRTLSRGTGPLKFNINILERSGECEIKESGVLVARANIQLLKNKNAFFNLPKVLGDYETYLPLKSSDVYLDLYEKGYQYGKEFQAVKYTDNRGTCGAIQWTNNWTTYIEGMLQMHLLRLNKQKHYVINHIQKVIIDPSEHMASINTISGDTGLPVFVCPNENIIKSGGIEIQGIKSNLVSLRTKQPELQVEQCLFVPHISDELTSLDKALSVCVQLVCEHNLNSILKMAEVIINPSAHVHLSSKIKEIIDREPHVTCEMTLLKNFSSESTTVGFPYNFIISFSIFSKPDILANTLKSLAQDAFLLSIESTESVPNEHNLNLINCKLISKFNTEKGVCVLTRKTPVWKTPMTVVVKTDNFNWIDGIKMALRKHKIDQRNTMIISHGSEPSGVVGLLKCIQHEPFGTGLRCLCTDDSIKPYKIVDLAYIDHFRKGLAFNVYKNGEWGSFRHLPVQKDIRVECEHAFVGLTRVGDFTSLTYMEGRIPFINWNYGNKKKLCHVYYATVYPHQDVFRALGWLPYEENTDQMSQGSVLGHEYSGRDSEGKRVCGMVGGGALATTVLADSTVMWDVPDQWTLEQASTVPRVYSVSYYALVMRGRLQKGETVYINAGISGLCTACLNVAIGVQAVPYIGFNNQTEKEYLLETLPQLSGSSLINLEEYGFEYQLLQATNGKGVDLIFDTLNSHKRNSFVDVLTAHGRLVEFEKSTSFNESLGYAAIGKNITFHKISHNTLWVSEAGKEDRIKIQKLVADGIQRGIVKPITTNVFTDQQIEEAFRLAQSGKFKGKVVIKFREEETPKNVIPKTKIVKAYPSAFLASENSYIVTAGLSEYGIQLVDWLIVKGANKIVLQTPYKPVTGYQSLALRRWREMNVNIILFTADITSLNGAEKLMEAAASLGTVGGIFHIGYVSCDCAFDETMKSHFELLWKSKVESAKCLDIASRNRCIGLKYFVGFSDFSSTFGDAKKSILGYSCCAMEMLYERRKMDGYPANVIQIGRLDKFEGNELTQTNGGFAVIKFSSILNILPILLNQPTTTLSVYAKENAERRLASKVIDKTEKVNKIANLLGIRSVKKYYSTTFEEIGLDPLLLENIKAYLKANNVSVTINDIKKLSLHKISVLLKGQK